MPQTATRISRLTLESDKVVSTGTIRVQNIYVANVTNTPAEVVFQDNDGVPILNMMVPAYDSDDFGGHWIADNGLKIIGLDDQNIIATIIHSDVGV